MKKSIQTKGTVTTQKVEPPKAEVKPAPQDIFP